MADLGSKTALNNANDARLPDNNTNAISEANVRDSFKDTVDTLFGDSGSAPTATFSTNTNTAQDPGQDTFRFNNATIGSVTEIALSDVVGGVDKGDLNSRFAGIIQFRLVGTTETIEFQIASAVHTSWTRYTVTYLKGTLPANGTVCAVRFLPSNTWDPLTHTREQHDGADLDSHEFPVYDTLEQRSERATGADLLTWIRTDIEDMFFALGTVAAARTGSAIAFDVPAEYNTGASPTNGAITADYTGAVAGTQVLLWCNHAAEPSWPAGWTVTGVWDNSALNAVILTYRTGTTVSGYIVSAAQGAATNPSRVYCLTADFAVTSATPLKIAGIEGIPVKAGKLYAIEWNPKGTCSGTSGGYFGLWADTGTDHDLFMAGRTDFAADAGVYFSIGANSGYNSAATSYPWFAATLASNFGRCAGTILGGAVDAVFEMRARSVNAAQTFTVTRRGTWFRITPLD